jgi:hypothetical protein
MTGQVHSVNRAFEFNDNLRFIFGEKSASSIVSR